jgi:putative copper export protein
MLSPTIHTFRLFVHVLAASVWVGGQLAVVGNTKIAARNPLARAAWPAFGLVVVTGLWSLTEVDVGDTSTDYQVTLFVKVLLAMASGAAAAVHAVGTGRVAVAVGGSIGLVAAIGAMYCGLLLTTGA